MVVTQEQLDSFYRFASGQMGSGENSLTFADLYEMWRIENPSPDVLRDDVRTVKAALRDMENGETGRPFEEFARDFRERNNVPDYA